MWKGESATEAQVESAVNAARNAFIEWKKLPFENRQAIVERFAELVKDNADSIAEVIAKRNG